MIKRIENDDHVLYDVGIEPVTLVIGNEHDNYILGKTDIKIKRYSDKVQIILELNTGPGQ